MYKQDWRDRKAEHAKPTRASPLPLEDPALSPSVRKYLESRELSYKLACRNGWYGTRDEFGIARVVMPATSRVNTWPYYQARALGPELPRYRSPAVPRGDALMVVMPERDTPQGVMILEGPMDALASAELGYVGIGLMGNRPNAPVINHLVELIEVYCGSDNACLIVPDSDAPLEGTTLAGLLWERGLRCYVKPLVGFKDLAGMPSDLRKLWF